LDRLGYQNVEVIGVDLPRWARFWKRGDLAMHVYYTVWQVLAFFVARKLQHKQRFDVAHHLSFMTIRTNMVPFLSAFSIVGPVGGAQVAPPGFAKVLRHPAKEWLRKLVILSMRVSPWWHAWLKKTDVLLLANRDNLWVIPEALRSRCMIRQIGWDAQLPNNPTALTDANAAPKLFQVFWGGRLIGWKGLEVLLRALGLVAMRGVDFHLHVTGKGVDADYLKGVATEVGIADKVSFHGFLPFAKVQELQTSSDVFAFTSLHETTGTALMEAMALGKALVVIDHAGPGDIADTSCAMMVPVNLGVKHAIEACADSLIKLEQDSDLRDQLGAAARARLVTNFGWENYINFIIGLYTEGARKASLSNLENE
jgi:glycosyltransferase involved in cell wall biosynthesis